MHVARKPVLNRFHATGDVIATHANGRPESGNWLRSKVTVEEGIPQFVDWFRNYYSL